MMDVTPLYNSRIISSYIEYLAKFHPDLDIQTILKECDITIYEVQDEGNWFTQKQVDAFYNVLMKETQDSSIARKAGRYIASYQASSILKQYVMGFLTPRIAYWMVKNIASTMSRAYTIDTRSISSNKVEVTFATKEGVNEKPYQCENRMGLLEAVPKMFNMEYAHIEHPQCMHKGNDCCKYIISWKRTPSSIWRTAGTYFTSIGILSSVLLFFLFPLPLWLTSILFIAFLSSSIFCYSEHLGRKEFSGNLRTQGDAADQLIAELNRHYNEATLIREIGQATSSILDTDKLLIFIMDTLNKRLDFDRGLIMLANRERNRLVYTVGYGYSHDQEKFLKNAEFHLDKPESKGQFVLSFKEQRPFWINSINEIEKEVTQKSLNFAKKLGAQSFICIPIIYEGKSEGVLVVDNIHTKKALTHSDLNLLLGIAPQIGISLNNARAYRIIEENEKKFEAISETAPDIIYSIEPNGTIIYVNPAVEKTLGYQKEELIGRNFFALVKGDDVELLKTSFKKANSENKTIRNMTATFISKNGTDRIINLSGAPVFDSKGYCNGINGTIKDITDLYNLESQLRHASKMEAIGTLTGGIAHDFNNIIQAISSYNQLIMMKKTGGEPDYKYLININKLTKRAADLIKQMLLLSRNMESSLKPVDLNTEIKKLYDILSNTIPKMISIELDLDEELNYVSGDSVQLNQVAMNLAVNARDAISENGKIVIRTKNIFVNNKYLHKYNLDIKTGNYAFMSVSDTGSGIDKETLEHIFEPFFTTKEAGKGTGLGLSVVYGIIKNHKGYIFCESELGIGTTFNIYIPSIKKLGEQETVAPKQREELSSGSETILLVDDETSLLETGQDILNHYGYSTLTARSGEEAIEVFRKENGNINLVILDLVMPGMGGQKCMLELLQINPQIKIIVSSGYSADAQMADLLKEGATAFIQKPYRFEKMLKEIRRILDQK